MGFRKRVLWVLNAYGLVTSVATLVGAVSSSTVVAVVVGAVGKQSWTGQLVVGACFFVALVCAAIVWTQTHQKVSALRVVPTTFGTAYYRLTDHPGRAIVTINVSLSNPSGSTEHIRVVNAHFEKCRRGDTVEIRRADAYAMVGTYMPDIPPGASVQAQVTADVDGLTDLDSDNRRLRVTMVLEDQFGRHYSRGVEVPRQVGVTISGGPLA